MEREKGTRTRGVHRFLFTWKMCRTRARLLPAMQAQLSPLVSRTAGSARVYESRASLTTFPQHPAFICCPVRNYERRAGAGVRWRVDQSCVKPERNRASLNMLAHAVRARHRRHCEHQDCRRRCSPRHRMRAGGRGRRATRGFNDPSPDRFRKAADFTATLPVIRENDFATAR